MFAVLTLLLLLVDITDVSEESADVTFMVGGTSGKMLRLSVPQLERHWGQIITAAQPSA
jgi:hypothetical protein